MHNTKEVADRILKILESVFEDEGIVPTSVWISIHGIDYSRMVSPEVNYHGGRTATPYVTEEHDDGGAFPVRRVAFYADVNTVPPEDLEVRR